MRASSIALALLFIVVAGCGGDDSTPTQADRGESRIDQPAPGPTPFIGFVNVVVKDAAVVQSLDFTVSAKPGATARPVHATYTMQYLRRRGMVNGSNTQIRLPVFGLYAGRSNQLQIVVGFADGSKTAIPLTYATAAYADPSSIYDRPVIKTARGGQAQLGFDYFFMKNAYGPPVVVDTDGEIRWAGTGTAGSITSILRDNGFIVGGPALQLQRIELDGTSSTIATIDSTTFQGFHHNIDPGKTGVLVELDAMINGQSSIENIAAEVDLTGKVLGEWDFAQILSRHMLRAGDDPSIWIRPGADWFHMNAAFYDPRDDTIVASSRENFVIKVDYTTGEIKWIFGDPAKYWYAVPSLRAKALTLTTSGLYPDGQHSINIAPTGDLLLFDNGEPDSPPPGFASAERRPFSSVASYGIDGATSTAAQHWSYEHDQTIRSPFCSSTQQSSDGSVLISYATADNATHSRLVGLDAQRNLVFDFQYNLGCSTAWNAQMIHFESMHFQ